MTFLPTDPSRRPPAQDDWRQMMGPWGTQQQTPAGMLGQDAPGNFAPANRQRPLPTPPPSVTAKKSTIWDKEHLAQTLAGISQAFLSNQDFGAGLGAAAGSLGSRMGDLKTEQKKAISYGGPDGQFEIAVDADGNRTIREVPEFAQAARDKRSAAKAPDAKVRYDMRSRALYRISKLPEQEQAAAYADLQANPQAYGVDPEDLRSEWTPTYGAVGGQMGLTVDQDADNLRGDRMTDSRIQRNVASTAQGAQRLAISERKDSRAAAKAASGPRSAPPSKRRGYAVVRDQAGYAALPPGSKYVAPDGSMRIKR